MKRTVIECSDLLSCSRCAEERIRAFTDKTVAASGICSLVLAGGTTPGLLYELLADRERKPAMPWDRIHLFWGDERCVGVDDSRSNYRMAKEALLDRITVPGENIHRIKGELPPEDAARQYEDDINLFFQTYAVNRFDITLLGMGADGHTASLFPHSPAPAEKDALVAAVNAPAGIQPADRVTLTLQALALSERVLFMIAGDEKRKLLDTIMSLPERAAQRYPAAAVRARSELYWMVSTR